MPSILTSEHYGDLLPDNILEMSDLDIRVEKAEYRVIDRYREERKDDYSVEVFGPIDDALLDIRLEYWRTDDNGKPDTAAMPDDLVRRLRLVIADVVKWKGKYEQTEFIDSESEGAQSASYSDVPSLPSRLFQPLDKYDERRPFIGYW